MNRKLIRKLKLDRYINHWIILMIDLAVSVICTFLACILLEYSGVFDFSLNSYSYILFSSLFASLISFFIWGIYKNAIRHTYLKDTWRLGIAVFTKIILLGVFLFLPQFINFRLLCGLLMIDLLITTIALFAVRIGMLIVYDAVLTRYQVEIKVRNILIYGCDTPSISLATGFNGHQEYKYLVLGFLNFGKKNSVLRVAGCPVFYFENRESFLNIVRRKDIHGILFPDYKSAQLEKDRLIRYCESKHIQVLIAPPVDEISGGKLMLKNIRKIRIEDLLGRDEIKINMENVIANFRDKTVLVTGAAGSIGSELCRQLATFGIKNLILFDSAETPMHTIRLELEDSFPKLEFIPVVGDVRIKARLAMVFRKYKPQVVFHAAAYKHVPLMEENPCEAVFVNVTGSRNVADLCVEFDVEKMVMISTDKAVNPTNVMGASKRLAEIYVQSLGLAIEKGEIKGKTKFVTTRFGNVLGSNGSVIVRFREQIEKGGPVTVTHPDILRFFMTIPEACRLVMEAATLGNGNEIFVFEMGEPVKIAYLAQRMIELAGLKPDVDIPIKFTGLRPGEKLYEEVLSNEENTLPTSHKKIRIAKVRNYDYDEIREIVSLLTKLSLRVIIPDTIKLMKQIIPEYKSKNSKYEMYDECVLK